jgi:hypothetical protein
MRDAETANRLLALADEAHGWPGRWLTAGDWAPPVLPVLKSSNAVAARVAPFVAACAAGFGEVARVLGIVAEVDVQAIGQSVLDDIGEQMAERGETVGIRLWNALEQDIASNPSLYPSRQEALGLGFVAGGKGLRGVSEDGYLYLFKDRAKDLAHGIEADLRAALRELEDTGAHIVLTPTRGRAERVSVGRTQVDTRVSGFSVVVMTGAAGLASAV